MPTKPKSLLKEEKGSNASAKAKAKAKSKKSRHYLTDPEAADEYLAAGVEQEEGGEKWRGGDAVKAMRFFMRAIEFYDNGLTKYPTSFDLAYNKARVQYEITQHPKLASQLPAPLAKILQIALTSHREALALQQDNADALFNTAQVLTSLAETITESSNRRLSSSRAQEALKYLEEALELFQRCLALQELRYTESQEQLEMMESGEIRSAGNEGEDAPMDTELKSSGLETEATESDERWAAVIEPVTKDTLVDTAVAQLETLTTLCGLLTLDPGSALVWVEEYSYDLLRYKIAAYVEGTERHQEVALARAKFLAALTEVLYRSGRIDIDTYQRELSGAFPDELDLSGNPEGLCSKAEALTAFNTALTDLPPNAEGQMKRSIDLRWQSLTAALDALTAASKLTSADNVAKIHIARGDTELSRWRLGSAPWNYTTAQQNALTLLKNAETYYRGAAALARRDGAADEEKEGECKEAIAAALRGERTKFEDLKNKGFDNLSTVAEDMVDDGLVTTTDMSTLMSPDTSN